MKLTLYRDDLMSIDLRNDLDLYILDALYVLESARALARKPFQQRNPLSLLSLFLAAVGHSR